MKKLIKCELYNIQSLICQILSTESKDFNANGKVIESSFFDDDYQAYEVPLLENDHESGEEYEHIITAVRRGDEFEVDLKLVY